MRCPSNRFKAAWLLLSGACDGLLVFAQYILDVCDYVRHCALPGSAQRAKTKISRICFIFRSLWDHIGVSADLDPRVVRVIGFEATDQVGPIAPGGRILIHRRGRTVASPADVDLVGGVTIVPPRLPCKALGLPVGLDIDREVIIDTRQWRPSGVSSTVEPRAHRAVSDRADRAATRPHPAGVAVPHSIQPVAII